jgi:hypothetical protein
VAGVHPVLETADPAAQNAAAAVNAVITIDRFVMAVIYHNPSEGGLDHDIGVVAALRGRDGVVRAALP